MIKRWILILCFLIIYGPVCSQVTIKQIKKQIPVKGVQSVEKTSISDSLFFFYTKYDTGLWDLASKKVLFRNLKNISPFEGNHELIYYTNGKENGIYNYKKSKILYRSNTHFILKSSSTWWLVYIFNTDHFGLVDLGRNSVYIINNKRLADTTFFENEDEKCFYSSVRNTIYYGCCNEYLTLSRAGNYIGGSGKIFNSATGEEIMKYKDFLYISNDFIITETYAGSRNYYDTCLNLLAENIPADNYALEDFQKLVDSNITRIKQIDDNTYLGYLGSKKRFYKTPEMISNSDLYDFLFDAGYDYINDGYTFFTVKGGEGYGIYNSWRGEELAAKYTLIEKRLFPDGSCLNRADNELHPIHYDGKKTISSWKHEHDKNSIIISHLSMQDNFLVVSPRKTAADNHDVFYNSTTYYEDGAGVVDLTDTSWVIKPTFHSITPFKEYYIAMKIGSTYRNASWLQTVIFDKDFNILSEKDFGVSFIYNGMLIMRDGVSKNYIEYDLKNRRKLRVLGEMNDYYGDFKLFNNYLIIGDNNYNDYKEGISGMDIQDIITPEGELVKIVDLRFRFVELLQDELVVIGKVRKNDPTDVPFFELSCEAYSIYDLRSKKIISPWFKSIKRSSYNNEIIIQEFSQTKKFIIPMIEIRNRF